MEKKGSVLKSYTLLSVFSVSEKVIAFIYQAVLASVLGAGIVTDCYYSASQLFDLIDTTVLGALVVVVINRFANISAEKSEEAGFSFLSNLNSILSIVIIIVSALVFAFAKMVSYLIAPGFDQTMRPDLVRCIRIMCIIPLITVYTVLCQGVLRQKKRFLIVNSRSLFISLCGMAVVLLFSVKDPTNSRILCYGYIAANLFYTVTLTLNTRRFGKIGFRKPSFDDDTKVMLKMAVPAIISKGIVRISLMIDQVISSTLGKGFVSYLNYAHSLYNIVSNILIVNLCVIMLTDFTKLCVNKKFEAMKAKLRSSICSILLLLAPITLLTIAFSREIVSIVYERGAFTPSSTQNVARLLLCYAIGFVPSMLNSVHAQVLHAFGKMHIAMRNSIVSIGLNILFSLVLSRYFGAVGIALGTTISISAVQVLYTKSVKKLLPDYQRLFEPRYLFKLFIGLIGCAGVIIPFKYLIKMPLLSFSCATICCFSVFILILFALKEETVMRYFGLIKGKLHKS